jgi:DNA-binding Xre family transcriptional regulator
MLRLKVLSESYLSCSIKQVSLLRNLKNISVKILNKLCVGLGISISKFFEILENDPN